MNRMWSNNKLVNTIVNILLFLVAINIFHYGQLLLPIICLILFIDNKFVLKISNIKIFILLCMFGFSFFAFSYKLGLFSVMGFCLPMGYYIGNNLKIKSGDEIKYLIYIIAFGMATHLILNFSLEFYWWHDNLSYLFNKVSHYDIWLMENITDKKCFWLFGCSLKNDIQPTRVKTTGSSMNFIMISTCIYYLLRFEKDRVLKCIGTLIFVLSAIYCVALGRRTTFILLFLAITISIVLDIKNNGSFRINAKAISFFVLILLLFVILYLFNAFGLKDIVNNTSLVRRFINKELSTDRFIILKKALPYYLEYPWGGQVISSKIGSLIHDLWGDIYDYGGIIPFVLMVVYSLHFLKTITLFIRHKKIIPTARLLLIVWSIICSLIMFIEPVMTGAALYLVCYLIIAGSIDALF